jgi:hypothetical protein
VKTTAYGEHLYSAVLGRQLVQLAGRQGFRVPVVQVQHLKISTLKYSVVDPDPLWF